MPRPPRRPPRDHSPAWPDKPCDDAPAEVARRLALRLRDALGDASLRTAKERTGVDHTTIADIVAGNTWPDIATLARLEAGLNIDLWPGRVRLAKRTTRKR